MRKLLLLLTIFLTSYGFAQKGGLKGQVLDETKQPLPGATIIVIETEAGTSTDFDGNYELLNIKNGTYKVSVSFIGYKTIEENVTISGGITVKNFNLTPASNKLDEIIVQGSIARGQAKALNKQKSNDNITNVISSDQVGKFPDANIGDALKRVPGIAMQNDQGEARDIIIRGLAPELNAVTLNGDRLPSAEGDNRRVQMDLIPSDMIQTIEVSKAVTPDMEADAIGGSVNLVTRSAPSTFRASVTSSYGMSLIRNSNNYSVSGIVADRTKNGKVGAVLNASYNSNDYGSDNVEFEWSKANFIKEHDIRRYDVKRIRKSVGLNLDWKPATNHSFEFKSIYNERDDTENRFRVRYKFDKKKDRYKITRQTKGGIDNDDNQNRRLERQQTYKLGVSGKHITLENIKLDWKLSVSKASEKRPNERYFTYVYKPDASLVKQNDLNTKFPYFSMTQNEDRDIKNYEIDEIIEEFKQTQEKKLSSRINIQIPLTTEGGYQNKIKFGHRHKFKKKSRENGYNDFTEQFEKQYEKMTAVTISDKTINGYLAGDQYKLGNFVAPKFLGGLTLKDGKAILEEFIPVNYNANETIHAFYGMLKQKLGNQFSFIAGLRAESTQVQYTGFSIDVETAKTLADVTTKKGEKSYINWLPNLQLKYKPTKNLVVRIAWTNTIARPNYYDLVPYENINSKKQEVEYGNPNLKAAQSSNFDIMGEYYFSNVGIISFGGFYKNIKDFIYTKTIKENLTIVGATDEYEVQRPYNGATANIYGFEIALQRKLNFLPSFLRNLTFYGNYTYTGSETKGIEGRKDGLALAGAVENMFNTSLAYETKKFTLRGSLNYADDYIDEYEGNEFDDTYYDEQLFIDVNASYEVIKNLRIFTEGKNLTNQPLRYYQGAKNRTKQVEYYGLNWNIGLKYNF